MKDKQYVLIDERYVLIEAKHREIIKAPKFFNTYDEAHKEMKKQYEICSKGGIGELNDDDAWCRVDGCTTEWKIFDAV